MLRFIKGVPAQAARCSVSARRQEAKEPGT